MLKQPADIVCCGHLCLDVIPRLLSRELPKPGELTAVGPADICSGGSVSNTGLSLHRLGVPVRLIGRVGSDPFGELLRRQLDRYDGQLSGDLLVSQDEPTSYSVVINPPGSDRRFLHCTGVNDSFSDAHVTDDSLRGARHLHFGYPPVMQAMCADLGQPLVRLFERARRMGLTTSLDMCGVDPATWAGSYDWHGFLENVLPYIDVFLPSFDELAVMSPQCAEDPARLLELGSRVVVVKNGQQALMIYAADEADQLVNGWGGLRLQAGTYIVDTRGTTGAGDATIAGFLAGLVASVSLQHAANLACAAGAFCVQASDATSGLRDIRELEAFVASRAPRRSA